MSFRTLSEQAPTQGKTVAWPLPLKSKNGPAFLHVEHLGETNTAFWHDALSRVVISANSPKKQRRDMSAPALAAAVAQRRNEKREIVIKHSVRDIENVFHDDGSPATKDDIGALVWALPVDVFDKLMEFVEDPANFRETFIDADVAEVAGK